MPHSWQRGHGEGTVATADSPVPSSLSDIGIESKDFVRRTGPDSKKRARLLQKLQDLIGRARFLAVREQLPSDDDSSEEKGSLTFSKSAEKSANQAHTGS